MEGAGLKIQYVSTWGRPCGIAFYTRSLSHALIQQGYEVIVSAEKGGTKWPPVISYNEWERPDMDAHPRAEVIHIQAEYAFTSDFNLIRLITKLRAHAKVYLTMHTINPFSTPPSIARLLLKAVTKFITITPSQTLIIKSLTNESDDKLKFIPHGTHPIQAMDKDQACRLLGLPEDKFIVLQHGFFDETKAFHIGAEAVRIAKTVDPEIVYLAVSSIHPQAKKFGKEVIFYLKEVMRRAASDSIFRISFLEERELDLYFSACDLIIYPYLEMWIGSPSGNAMRGVGAGKPIIASRSPRLELLSSLMQAPATPKGFASAILRVKQDSMLQKELSKRVKELGQSCSWQNVAKIHASEYEEGKIEFPYDLFAELI